MTKEEGKGSRAYMERNKEVWKGCRRFVMQVDILHITFLQNCGNQLVGECNSPEKVRSRRRTRRGRR